MVAAPFIVLALALGATAQSSVSPSVTGSATAQVEPSGTPDISGISQCVISCSQAAAPLNGCASFADLPCVCGSAQFQADATKCLEDNCTADDLTAALALQSQQCGQINVTPSGTAGPAQTISLPASGSDSSSGSTRPTSTAGTNGTDENDNDDGSGVAAGANVLGMLVAGVAAVFAL